ncbi:MAG: hypothetical protein KC492_43785, partial [Myxococcales bacterium]|nr:hypothetical protein [Myxococcales bacterium]
MALRSVARLGLFLSVSCVGLLLVVSGCGSDDSGGSSGSGGSAASGGTAGSAGIGGTAGVGGSAGTGGAPPSCDVYATSAAPSFVRNTAAWGLEGVVGNRISAVDLDGDDYPDLIVHGLSNNTRAPNSAPTSLILMNRPKAGGGREFVDETLSSGYGVPRDGDTENQRSTQLAVAADVDNDGDLDLFSGTYTDKTKLDNPQTPGQLDRSEVLLNDGSGHFSLA